MPQGSARVAKQLRRRDFAGAAAGDTPGTGLAFDASHARMTSPSNKEHPMSHRPIIHSFATALLSVLLSACAHTRVTRFDANVRPERRTPAASIKLYGAQSPSCAYDELGRITAESRPFVTWGRVVKAARSAAHDLGGDAIVGVRDNARISGATVTPEGVAIGETSSLSGIVIRFKDVDCMT
jgi:hypothetical protein